MTEPFDRALSALRATNAVLEAGATRRPQLPGREYLADLLEETVRYVTRFVVFDRPLADAVALWNAHTYVYRCATATPYLYAYSPEPGSGKTTLLDVLSVLASNAVQADNLTEAVLFRLIDQMHPTLLIDEVDAIFGRKNADSTEGIRQVLNSGYRAGKCAYRCVPPSHEVVAFDVYCPKALAGLNQLPGTLAHRSIPIALKPPRPDDVYEDFDHEDAAAEAELLTINLQSWAAAAEAEAALRDPRLKPPKLPELDARGNEIWRILFRIGDMAGGDWPDRARHAAVELSGTQHRHSDASTGVQLLGHIRGLFDDERLTCRGLADALNGAELSPYGGWNDGKGITTRELGKKLAPYGVLAKSIRIAGKPAGNGYDRDQFEDAWSRYLPSAEPSNQYTGTTRIVEPNPADSKPVQAALLPVTVSLANRHEYSDVPVVPVSNPAPLAEEPEQTAHQVHSTHRADSEPVSSERHEPSGRPLEEALLDPMLFYAAGLDEFGAVLSRASNEPTPPAETGWPTGDLIGTCERCGQGVGDSDPTYACWTHDHWRFTGYGLKGSKRLPPGAPLLCCSCAVRAKYKLIDPPVLDSPLEERQ